MLEAAMPSLLRATLSIDDEGDVRETMRTPLIWVAEWNWRALQLEHAIQSILL